MKAGLWKLKQQRERKKLEVNESAMSTLREQEVQRQEMMAQVKRDREAQKLKQMGNERVMAEEELAEDQRALKQVRQQEELLRWQQERKRGILEDDAWTDRHFIKPSEHQAL